MSDTSPTQTGPESNDEQRLEAVIADYIRACESGTPPNRREIMERHPELADELRQFFGQHDRMNQMAEPIRDFGEIVTHTVGPGQRLSYVGNYELLEEVARGGMGVVYRARQTTLGRIVAVKMIVKGRLASEQDVQRFLIEAREAGGLQHPNIVAIHEVGQHEGWHYFSMDFVRGRDLSAILRENLLSAKQAATYVQQMAEAIHYAHQQGTLHRDLKPSNILIDEQDQVRITDFGLAMRVDGDSDLTQTGQILGTPSYMPPEQAQSKRSLIGPGSDVYSLGAILYECLTGRAPFRADSVIKTIEQVIHTEAASPRLLNPGIPRDLETICLKCLQKEPHRRYGTAQLLAEDLHRFLEGQPILARPTKPWERAAKWVRRHPASAALTLISIVATLAVVVALANRNYSARLEIANANLETTSAELQTTIAAVLVEKTEADRQRVRAKEAEVKARRYLYASRMALIEVAKQNDQPMRIVQLLRSVIPEADQEDLRGFEWYELWREYHGEESRLSGHTGSVIAVACSPDGKWIASGSSDRTIKIWNAITGKEERTLVGHTDRVRGVAFSLDGEKLVSASTDNVYKVWDFRTGREIDHMNEGTLESGSDAHSQFWKLYGGNAEFQLGSIHPASSGPVFNFDRSLSAKTVRSKSRGFRASVTLEIADSEGQPLASFDVPAPINDIAFSADGNMVAAAVLYQSIRVWNARTGDPVCTLYAMDNVKAVAFLADMSGIVAGTERRLVVIWTLPGHQKRLIHQGKKSSNNVAFGAEGTILAAVCDGEALTWNVATGAMISKSPAGQYSRVGLSPINGWMSGAPSNQVVDMHTKNVIAEFTNPGSEKGPYFGGALGCDFSKDESLVAQADGAELVTVHSLKNGEPLLRLAVPSWASCVAFSPSTKYLAAGSGIFASDVISPGAIIIQEIATGHVVYEERLPLEVWWLDFSPDGSLLAAALGLSKDSGQGTGCIRIWETENWQTVYDLRGHSGCAWSVAFDPSGTRLASVGGLQYPNFDRASKTVRGDLKIWDTSTGLELLTITAPSNPIYGVAFSPDGTLLATAGGDGSVRILNGGPLAETPLYEPLPEE